MAIGVGFWGRFGELREVRGKLREVKGKLREVKGS